MIVKNEMANLKRCLGSITDHIGCWVIGDTGSSMTFTFTISENQDFPSGAYRPLPEYDGERSAAPKVRGPLSVGSEA